MKGGKKGEKGDGKMKKDREKNENRKGREKIGEMVCEETE